MNGKRIAIIGIKDIPATAGADRVIESLLSRFEGRPFHLSVYLRKNGNRPTPPTLENVDFVQLPCLKGKHLSAFSLFIVSALHALTKGRYDFVHVHNVDAGFICPLLRLRYPVISTSHGQPYLRKKWGAFAKLTLKFSEKLLLKFSNYVTSVSLPLAESYKRDFGIQAQYLPNGVDSNPEVDLKAALSVLEEYHMGRGEFILFVAGRIDETKGLHLLLDALDITDLEVPTLIIGDFSHDPLYSKRVLDRIRSRPNTSAITHLLDKATLLGVLSQSRMFVFPSFVEAMSMILLEAASVAVPIICSDIPENVSVLPNDRAMFFHSGSSDSLADTLSQALMNPKLPDLGLSAQEYVKETFSWSRIADEYQELYLTRF
jgi:glycosyltransferase involved in cell wall biosynthesis